MSDKPMIDGLTPEEAREAKQAFDRLRNPAFEQKRKLDEASQRISLGVINPAPLTFRQELIVSIAGGLMAAPNVSGKPDQLAGYIVNLATAIIEAEEARNDAKP
jgi:alkanesulfonate monooxygenase SsuD/methylene tetrahydromethanopterin reductase-like flavin-dependent oxidoreductase (luciferase family)